MAAKAIPPDLEPEILKRVGKGWSPQKVSDWLLEKHQVTASRMAVQRLLVRIREERAPIAQAIVQSQLAATITADLAGIDDLLKASTDLLKRAGNLQPQLRRLKKIQQASIVDLFDADGKLLAKDKIPAGLKVALKKIKIAVDGTVTYEVHDKLRAIAEHVGIQTGAVEELRRLLETRLRLAGAGEDDDEAVRDRVVAGLEEWVKKKA